MAEVDLVAQLKAAADHVEARDAVSRWLHGDCLLLSVESARVIIAALKRAERLEKVAWNALEYIPRPTGRTGHARIARNRYDALRAVLEEE